MTLVLKNTFQFVDPEQVVAGDMINILDEDDKVFDVKRTVPGYLFTLEKSMYSAISDEMLKFFAGVIEFPLACLAFSRNFAH